MPFLTIGMASYNNFKETLFTLEALRLYQDLEDTEILVVDNYGDDTLRETFTSAFCDSRFRYIRYTERQGTAAPRDQVFAQAKGEWVLCIDSHVMLPTGTISRFREWCKAHRDCKDLIQGPLLYDDLRTVADAWDDVWTGSMWGLWRVAKDSSPEKDSYEIPMMGLGLFASRKDSWLGFNKQHKGFGGEEGYIHIKYRQAGRKTLCLPFLRWWHYFSYRNQKMSADMPYTPLLQDKINNYLNGFKELGIDPTPIYNHYKIPRPKEESSTPANFRRNVITNVQLDPNAFCGSKCWFCPVRFVPRPPGQTMPQNLFESLLNNLLDAVNQGSIDRNFNLWLSSYNDILLDPHLRDRLQALRARQLKFVCLSNGIGLKHNVNLLNDYRDVINGFSFDIAAGNPADYKRHTDNSENLFTNIIEGFQALHKLDPEYYPRVVHIGVNGFNDTVQHRNQLIWDLPLGDTDKQVSSLKSLLPMYPRIEAMRPLCDRAGNLKLYSIDNKVSKPQTTGCNKLTDWLYINSFGQAYTCCQDYSERHCYADLTKTSVHEVLKTNISSVINATIKDLCVQCVFAR